LPEIYNKFSTEAVLPYLIVLRPGHDKLQNFSEAKLMKIMYDVDSVFKVLSNGTLILPVTVSGDL